MKKTEKAGFGGMKKVDKKSRQMLTGRVGLATAVDARKVESRARRRCA